MYCPHSRDLLLSLRETELLIAHPQRRHERGHIATSFEPTEAVTASSTPAATQRSIIVPPRHRLTFRFTDRVRLMRLSAALVVASERRRRGDSLSVRTVSVSSRPRARSPRRWDTPSPTDARDHAAGAGRSSRRRPHALAAEWLAPTGDHDRRGTRGRCASCARASASVSVTTRTRTCSVANSDGSGNLRRRGSGRRIAASPARGARAQRERGAEPDQP